MSLTSRNLVEAYTFTGSFKTYGYTSADRNITVDGLLHERAAISRGAVKAGDQTQDQLDVELTLPYNLPVVLDHAYLSAPPKLNLKIVALDRSTENPAGSGLFASASGAILWNGEVAGWSVSGRQAKVRVPSNFSRALNQGVPSVFFQNPCNHVLFDGRCKVAQTNFRHVTNVTSIGSPTVIGVTSDNFDDNFLNAGSIQNSRTGERRLIITNLSDAITIGSPFTDIQVGDEVVLLAGCDHSFSTCRTKFNNSVNYGGHPFIPGDNPFAGEL